MITPLAHFKTRRAAGISWAVIQDRFPEWVIAFRPENDGWCVFVNLPEDVTEPPAEMTAAAKTLHGFAQMYGLA